MKKILQYLFEHKTLGREMAKEVLVNIGKGVYNEPAGAFLPSILY